ncbi:hypothetical protein COOONC_10752 [Cooperia oncophora]
MLNDSGVEWYCAVENRDEAEFLFNTHPDLEKYTLNRQVGFDFKTRDDMVLQAYLSLPPEVRFR